MTKKKLDIKIKNRMAEQRAASMQPHARMRVKSGLRSMAVERELCRKLRTSYNFDCRMSYWQLIAANPAIFDVDAVPSRRRKQLPNAVSGRRWAAWRWFAS